MMERGFNYNERRVGVAPAGSFSPDDPVEGLYRVRLVRHGPFVGVRIWYGQPLDPVTRDPLDRSLRWQATVNGDDIPLERVWPACAEARIDRPEYDRLCALQKWGRDNGVEAFSNPRKGTSPLKSPLPF